MNVVFFNFAKRPNSTKIPAASEPSVTAQCKLLENCSILTPSIVVEHIGKTYTYVYIPDFARYYFVHKVTILNAKQWQYDLVIDVLASHKSQIVNSNQYVLRAAENYSLKLVDNTAVHTSDFSENVNSIAFPQYDATGCYFITVVNALSANSANPASTMYVINQAGLSQLIAEMFDLDAYSNLSDVDLTATYFNPQQYVTSCKWFPFSFNSINSEEGTPFELVKYGWYTAKTAGAYRVINYGKKITFSFTLGSYNDWTDRNNEWTRYTLYVPGFGVTDIDAAFSGQTLTGTISIDYNTGGATLILTTGTGQICASMSGQLGVEVAINQVGGSMDFSPSGLINKGVSFVGSMISGGGGKTISNTFSNFLKVIPNMAAGNYQEAIEAATQTLNIGKEAASNVADAAKNTFLNPTVTTSGADGARKTIIDNHTIYLYRRKYSIYNSNRGQRLGLPVHKREALSNYHGYVLCANGTINMSCFAEEKNAIVDFLEGGFFIE